MQAQAAKSMSFARPISSFSCDIYVQSIRQ